MVIANEPDLEKGKAKLRANLDTLISKNYDFKAADAAHAAVVGNTEDAEIGITFADEAMRRLVKAVKGGPEVYEVFRAVGKGYETGDFKEAFKEALTRYPETRLGPAGGAATEAIEHHEELANVAQEARKLAEVLDGLEELLKEYDMQAEDAALPIIQKTIQEIKDRKHPERAALRTIVLELAKGTKWNEAVGKAKWDIKVAAKKYGGKPAKQVANAGVDAVSGNLKPLDEAVKAKVEDFKKKVIGKLNDVAATKNLDSEMQKELVNTLVEKYTEQLLKKAEKK